MHFFFLRLKPTLNLWVSFTFLQTLYKIPEWHLVSHPSVPGFVLQL